MSDRPLIHFKREEEEPQGIILARLCFNPHDMWRGLYWKFVWCKQCQRKHLNVWLILVPCFPLHVIFRWRWEGVWRWLRKSTRSTT
jgi:hypothetical protein